MNRDDEKQQKKLPEAPIPIFEGAKTESLEKALEVIQEEYSDELSPDIQTKKEG